MTIDLKLPASWKTTLSGIVLAALGFTQVYMIHDWRMIVKDPMTLALFVTAILGLSAKDANVTGGTVGQASTPDALHAANQEPSKENAPVAKP